jgi:hypothetical protein
MIRSNRTRAFLTRIGGHLGPIEFKLGAKTIAPMYVAPWAEEPDAKKMMPLLAALRGDFFCAPFGGNGTPWRGEKHPPHGETANSSWTCESLSRVGGRTRFQASLATKIRRGRVDKFVTLVDGHSVVYQRHVLSSSRSPDESRPSRYAEVPRRARQRRDQHE